MEPCRRVSSLQCLILSALARIALVASGPGWCAGVEKRPLPREPQRTIEFSTDEVTWLCLDVSPDGSRIAFISDRDGREDLWIAAADRPPYVWNEAA